MSKIVLPSITNGQDLTNINNNFASIAAALNTQVLYRLNPIGEDNTIGNDLDFNGHKLYNVSDVLINGISISSEANVATAAATQAAVSATTAMTQAGIATAAANSATAITAGALQKTNNLSDLSNAVTAKGNLGMGAVDNTSDANKPVSTAQATAIALKANTASPTFSGTVGGITATMVGLGNVTNTSDANKPVSTAQQTALNLKANLASPTGTGTATWPVLAASASTHLTYKNTSAQSLNATPATIAGWTSVFDSNSNFNAATGVFTAPSTGFYLICGQIAVVLVSPPVGSQTQAIVVANGATVLTALHVVGATTEAESVIPFNVLVSLTAGQTALVQGYSSTTFSMSNAANINVLSIVQIP